MTARSGFNLQTLRLASKVFIVSRLSSADLSSRDSVLLVWETLLTFFQSRLICLIQSLPLGLDLALLPHTETTLHSVPHSSLPLPSFPPKLGIGSSVYVMRIVTILLSERGLPELWSTLLHLCP